MSAFAISFLYLWPPKYFLWFTIFSSRTLHTTIVGDFFLHLYSVSQFAEQFPGNFYFTLTIALRGWPHSFPLRRVADKTSEAN